MRALDLLEAMTKAAKEYRDNAQASIARNAHMHNAGEVKQEDIDAVLVDFINNVAGRYWIDYALYAKDLKGADQ